jgi:hypothetical protein
MFDQNGGGVTICGTDFWGSAGSFDVGLRTIGRAEKATLLDRRASTLQQLDRGLLGASASSWMKIVPAPEPIAHRNRQ